MNNFIVIIPARLKSVRLKEKLLQQINNKPLLYYSYHNAINSGAKEVIIATDSHKIISVMQKFGAKCVLTSSHHTSGSSRIAEVLVKENIKDDEVIVNLQGDEPMLGAKVILQVAKNLAKKNYNCATICENISSENDYLDNNCVKVVFDYFNKALYFSRSPVPHFRDNKINLTLCYKHIGIYAYNAAFIKKYIELNSSYELVEKLEQLSILQNGYTIHVDIASEATGIGVDTIDDLKRLKVMLNDN